MGSKLSTTLKKIESCSKQNRELLQEFYRYRQSLDHKSDLATNNILTLLIYFDRFLDDRSFQDISKKEQIIDFLEHKFVSKHGNWVKREHDLEGKWITTWNQYLIWLKTFFRWLGNRDVQEDESNWETPTFLQKIKSKKPLRDSPYEDS